MLASKKKPKDVPKVLDPVYEDPVYVQPVSSSTYPDWVESEKHKYMRFYTTKKCIVYLVYYKHSMDCKTFMCVWETLAGEQIEKSFDELPFYTAYETMLKFVDNKQREQLKTIAR